MTPGSDLQKQLRPYLLGQVDDQAAEAIEKEFLVQDHAFDELLVAEDELIDDYISESLNAADRAAFESHFLKTPERRGQLKFGRALTRYFSHQQSIVRRDKPPRWWASPRTFFASPWRAVAFAAVLLAVGFGAWHLFNRQSAVDEGLLALNSAYCEQRPLESRISNFNYAPYVVTRGPSDERIDRNELRRAELTLLNELNKNQNPAVYHALGKVYLAQKDFDKAIEHFNEAIKAAPRNAEIFSDLGAAWLEKGKADAEGSRVQDFARSLGYLNSARELDNNLLPALFNRALCRQQLTLWDDAQNDWQEYLRKDPNSPWAAEARQNLKLVEERRKVVSQEKKEIFQAFLKHFNAHDDANAWLIISSNHDRSGNVVVENFVDDYLDAAERNDPGTASQQLNGLTYVADLEKDRAGDRYFSDIVRFYESTNSHQKALISQARTRLKSGLRGWGQSRVDESLADFHQAKDLFAQAGDQCEQALSEYWISFCYYRQHDDSESSTLLQPLLTLCQDKRYRWLQVRVLYLLAAIQIDSNEHSKAIEFAGRSLAVADETNDVVGALNALSSLTEYYRYLGNYEKSLACLERSLPLASSISMDPIQRIRVYGFQATALASAGYYAAAADYQSQALRLALATGNVATIAYSSTFLAIVNGKLGKFEAAFQNAQMAYDTAASHSNDAADRELMADALLQMGNLYQQQQNFADALVHYDRSVQLYQELNQPTGLYQAHKGKLYCFIANGDDALAKTEIQQALSLVEQNRDKIFEENNRESFFQAQQNLYDLAIDFEYSKMKDVQESFRLSEMSRGRSLLDLIHSDSRLLSGGPELDLVLSRVVSPLTTEQIQSRMPDETQILQYAVLKDKLIVWLVSKEKISSFAKPINEQQLQLKVVTFLRLVSSASSDAATVGTLARELFRILIEPAAAQLDSRKLICIVPDKSLNYLPFQAMVSSSGRYLFEDYAMVLSPAASVFIDSCDSARQKDRVKSEKLLSVGNPAFDKKAYPSFTDLPSAATEAREIAAYYQSSQVLVSSDATVKRVKQGMERADVIHLAAHSVLDERFPLRSRLLLAKGAGESSEAVMPAFEIYKLNLQRARLVVLSACQTGANRYYEGEGMISLVRPFIVDRVPLVVASWWPVDSDATRELMQRFHQHRTVDRLSTTEALRRAQKEMLTVADGSYAHPYYWAAFMVVGGYARF
jgi:CHAT domain-containing protein